METLTLKEQTATGQWRAARSGETGTRWWVKSSSRGPDKTPDGWLVTNGSTSAGCTKWFGWTKKNGGEEGARKKADEECAERNEQWEEKRCVILAWDEDDYEGEAIYSMDNARKLAPSSAEAFAAEMQTGGGRVGAADASRQIKKSSGGSGGQKGKRGRRRRSRSRGRPESRSP